MSFAQELKIACRVYSKTTLAEKTLANTDGIKVIKDASTRAQIRDFFLLSKPNAGQLTGTACQIKNFIEESVYFLNPASSQWVGVQENRDKLSLYDNIDVHTSMKRAAEAAHEIVRALNLSDCTSWTKGQKEAELLMVGASFSSITFAYTLQHELQQRLQNWPSRAPRLQLKFTFTDFLSNSLGLLKSSRGRRIMPRKDAEEALNNTASTDTAHWGHVHEDLHWSNTTAETVANNLDTHFQSMLTKIGRPDAFKPNRLAKGLMKPRGSSNSSSNSGPLRPIGKNNGDQKLVLMEFDALIPDGQVERYSFDLLFMGTGGGFDAQPWRHSDQNSYWNPPDLDLAPKPLQKKEDGRYDNCFPHLVIGNSDTAAGFVYSHLMKSKAFCILSLFNEIGNTPFTDALRANAADKANELKREAIDYLKSLRDRLSNANVPEIKRALYGISSGSVDQQWAAQNPTRLKAAINDGIQELEGIPDVSCIADLKTEHWILYVRSRYFMPRMQSNGRPDTDTGFYRTLGLRVATSFINNFRQEHLKGEESVELSIDGGNYKYAQDAFFLHDTEFNPFIQKGIMDKAWPENKIAIALMWAAGKIKIVKSPSFESKVRRGFEVPGQAYERFQPVLHKGARVFVPSLKSPRARTQKKLHRNTAENKNSVYASITFALGSFQSLKSYNRDRFPRPM